MPLVAGQAHGEAYVLIAKETVNVQHEALTVLANYSMSVFIDAKITLQLHPRDNRRITGNSGSAAALCAICSLVMGRLCRSDTAVTALVAGEPLLHAVAGLQLKADAMRAAGLRRLVMATANENDWNALPPWLFLHTYSFTHILRACELNRPNCTFARLGLVRVTDHIRQKLLHGTSFGEDYVAIAKTTIDDRHESLTCSAARSVQACEWSAVPLGHGGDGESGWNGVSGRDCRLVGLRGQRHGDDRLMEIS
ncbi:hypothetical protein niasHS_008916 [Heterodera schachtii]|uniref:Uncharacterized protein n=1 Tax=Heterodera schachtii TaxID=97005 RepID=A0ABD2J2E2_HETSC